MPRQSLDDYNAYWPFFLWGEGEQIDVRHFANKFCGVRYAPAEVRVKEVHIKPDGCNDGSPSVMLVLEADAQTLSFLQLSTNEIKPIFNALKAIVETQQHTKPEL